MVFIFYGKIKITNLWQQFIITQWVSGFKNIEKIEKFADYIPCGLYYPFSFFIFFSRYIFLSDSVMYVWKLSFLLSMTDTPNEMLNC